MSNDRYVDQLLNNAALTLDPAKRAAYVDKLNGGDLSRAEVLLDIVKLGSFVEKQQARSLVLLHYFAYLHRNPDDPPDNSWKGFDYWTREVQEAGDDSKLAQAFMASFEYEDLHKKPDRAVARP